MGTRSGDVDPGALQFIMHKRIWILTRC
ncbi:MAG: hypothetical protein ACLTBV_20515 [Enterocloster bolteae]